MARKHGWEYRLWRRRNDAIPVADEETAQVARLASPASQRDREVLVPGVVQWPDVPVPMVGDRSPREAMHSADGRRKVIEFLRLYEHDEVASTRATGQQPFDLSNLWCSVGLDPEERWSKIRVGRHLVGKDCGG